MENRFVVNIIHRPELSPEYAEKALLWLCEQTKEEPPAWMEDLENITTETEEKTDALPEIG